MRKSSKLIFRFTENQLAAFIGFLVLIIRFDIENIVHQLLILQNCIKISVLMRERQPY